MAAPTLRHYEGPCLLLAPYRLQVHLYIFQKITAAPPLRRYEGPLPGPRPIFFFFFFSEGVVAYLDFIKKTYMLSGKQ